MNASQRRRKAQQLKARARRIQQQKAQNDPAQVTQPLTPKTLNAETAAATRTKFGPLEQQLQGEVGASNQMQANIGSWFDDFVRHAQGAQGTSGQGYQTAADQIARIAGAARGGDSATHDAMAKQLQADAAARGSSVDTNDATASKANDARGQLLTILGGQLAKQGAAANDYLGGRVTTASGQGAQAKTNELRHLRGIQGKQRDLATQKGDFTTQYKSQARDSERKYALEQEALGVKQNTAAANQDLQAQKLNLAAKALKVNDSTKRRGQNKQSDTASQRDSTTRRGQDLGHQDRQDAIAHKKGRKGGPTRADRVGAQRKLEQAQTLINGFAGSSKSFDQQKMVNGLVNSGIDDPTIALAAVQIVKFGGVGPNTAAKLKRRYHLKLKGFPARRPSHNPLQLPGAGA